MELEKRDEIPFPVAQGFAAGALVRDSHSTCH